jgi:hypothetical protein
MAGQQDNTNYDPNWDSGIAADDPVAKPAAKAGPFDPQASASVPYDPNWDPKVEAPQKEPNYANMGWREGVGTAISNVPKGIWDTGAGLYHAATNPSETAAGISGLARAPTSYLSKGVNAGIDYLGGAGTAQAADDWARSHIGNTATDVLQNTVHYVPPNKMDAATAAPAALGAQKAEEYGTPSEWMKGDFSKLKKTLISQPLTPVLDAASIVDPALRLGAAARTVDAAGVLGSSRFADALAESGLNLRPQDIPPQYHQAIADLVTQKGISPATVREAVGSAASGGATPPRGTTTGFRPASGARDDAADAAAAGARQTSEQLGRLAGGAPLSPEELGQGFQDAVQAARNRADAAYTQMRGNTDTFHPGLAQHVGAHMEHALATENPVYAAGAPTESFEHHAPVQKAVQNAVHQLSNPPASGLTMDYVDQVRRQLRDGPEGAKPTTRHFLRTATEGFDNAVGDVAAHPEGFSGSGAQVAQAIGDARAAATQHFGSFGTDASIPQAVKSSIRNFPEDANGAGQTLHNALTSARTGPGLHAHLGQTDVAPLVNDYVRRHYLNGPSAHVDEFLNGPMGPQVLNPDELNHARFLNEGRKVFESPGVGREPESWGRRVAAPLAVAAGSAFAGSHLLPDAGWAAPAISGAVGILGEQGVEHLANMAGIHTGSGRELAGAPRTNPVRHAVGVTGRAGVTGAAGANDINESYYAGRPHHARGGKVGHQYLVDRLFRHVEKAKKAEKGRTSAILQQPDEMVAKALNVAQAAI